MIKPKVSMVTPCYNGEKHLVYFLESLLEQDYLNVEFFFVDDGSTDSTKEIFDSYILKLEEKGWDVKYIYKENGGAASAINAALPLISGKYFTWVDSDDILYKNNISEKVKYMEEHPELGIAYCIIDVVKDNDLNKIIRQDLSGEKYKTAYKEVLNEREIFWPPIKAIINTKAIFDVLPNKKIIDLKGGQNCQVQLPILHKYKAGFIPKSLGKYVLRANSHSRNESKNFLRKRIKTYKIWINVILTLNTASNQEKIYLILKVTLRNILMVLKYFLSNLFSAKIKEKYIKIIFFGFKIKFKRTHKK